MQCAWAVLSTSTQLLNGCVDTGGVSPQTITATNGYRARLVFDLLVPTLLLGGSMKAYGFELNIDLTVSTG